MMEHSIVILKKGQEARGNGDVKFNLVCKM